MRVIARRRDFDLAAPSPDRFGAETESGPGEEVDRLSRRVSEARLRLRLRWMSGCEGECGEVGVVGDGGDEAEAEVEVEAEEIGEVVVIGEGVDEDLVMVEMVVIVGDIVKKVMLVMGKGQTSGGQARDKGGWQKAQRPVHRSLHNAPGGCEVIPQGRRVRWRGEMCMCQSQ